MIAIHLNDSIYSNTWDNYCKRNKIEFVGVNIYESNIIDFLIKNNIKILLAHIDLSDLKIKLISKSILLAIEKSGIKVFPDHNTFWHYDDKISQKYIFESLQIPHAHTNIFYSEGEAMQFLSYAKYPLVFKLRCGAGSSNVILLKSLNEAKCYIKKMFGRGLKPFPSVFNDYKTRMSLHSQKNDLIETLIRMPVILKNRINANFILPREKNYFLVQNFLSGNDFDTRVTIIGDIAFAFRRFNRPHDFKASGSGNIDLNHENIDKRAIALAFEAARKINSQSMSFDIIFDNERQPVIIEMSYISATKSAYNSGGYWDSSLTFHNEPVHPEEAIIESVMKSIKW